MTQTEQKRQMHPEVMELLGSVEIKNKIAFLSVDAMNYWLNRFLPRPRKERQQIAVGLMLMVERFKKVNLKIFCEAIVQLTVLVTILLANQPDAKKLAKKAGLSTAATDKTIGKKAMDYEARLKEKKPAGPGGALGLFAKIPKTADKKK